MASVASIPAVPVLALDYKGASQATGLSVRTLEKLVAANEIDHARIGGRVTFPVRELTKWLSDRAADQRGDRRLKRSA